MDRQPAAKQIIHANAILFVFPLYVDALPMPLLKVLLLLEEAHSRSTTPAPRVYAVCHNGFFEAAQNKTALKIMAHFCTRSGMRWQGGVGIGAGVYMANVKTPEKGTPKAMHDAPMALGTRIRDDQDAPQEDVFVAPSMPRMLYRTVGNVDWRVQAGGNKVFGQLRARPYTQEGRGHS